MQTKYLFVTGGVVSSLGKGLTAAAIGLLLEKKGLNIALLKLDPYLNVDPGTMSPYQHGEVYVTDDGAETDLDLGHYHRYTHSPLSRASNATSGQIYDTVIKKERRGDYLGKTVQVIPHVTDEIKSRIRQAAMQQKDTDVLVVEIGGTIGDIESLPFLEAIRQFQCENQGLCYNIHLTYVPYLSAAGEVKTKPTQHSVQALRQIGLVPDMIICRCEQSLDPDIKEKISLFCNVPKQAVIEERDVEHSIYEVPVCLKREKVDDIICQSLGLPNNPVDLSEWEDLVHRIKHPQSTVTIGVVGKYVQHQDAYKSVFESLQHAAIALNCRLDIRCFEPDKLSSGFFDESSADVCDGYLVPGGFGERGWEGKIDTAKYCREQKIPYFGICLGMQVLVVEFARHVLGLTQANSTEIDPDSVEPVISLLAEQQEVTQMGGTMRLGAYPCRLKELSKAAQAYGSTLVHERHRHRYEFNGSYQKVFEEQGVVFSGQLEGGDLCEIAELKDHPWMLGVQFHPEFQSKPTAPHPLFLAFVRAALERSQACEAKETVPA